MEKENQIKETPGQKVDFNAVKPFAEFDQRVKLITSFRWWPVSLLLGAVLAALFEYYDWPIRGGGDFFKQILWWVMILALFFGFYPPIIKWITTPHSTKVISGFSLRRFLKMLLIGFGIMVLIFVILGTWSYYNS